MALRRAGKTHEIVRALSVAFDPLIDLCLELGVTSPELESLLRYEFVRRAFEKLPSHPRTGRPPTTAKVSVAAGVHRNAVGKIRSGGTVAVRETLESKERHHSRAARVIQGWRHDSRFLTSAGLPIDLPIERNKHHRSFEDLVHKYAKGHFPSTVLKELKRRGNVQLLDGDIVHLRVGTPSPTGVTPVTVAEAALAMSRLGTTVLERMASPEHGPIFEETRRLRVSENRRAYVRLVLEQRSKEFIRALEDEFGEEQKSDTTSDFAVGVFSFKDETPE